MDVVVSDQRINGGMKFDTGHLGSAEGFVEVDVVDMVSGNLAESASHAAANSGRPAIVDRIVSNNVRSYLLF